MIVRSTSDIAGPTRAGTNILNSLSHSTADHGVLAHPEVVVATPNDHVTSSSVRLVKGSIRESASVTL